VNQLHGFVGMLALVLTALAALWSVGNALAGKPPGRLFVGNLVWVVIGVVLAAASGGLVAIAQQPPEDPLHVVYGIIALGTVAGTALLLVTRPEGQRSAVLSIGGIVLAILLFRLVETGG
jgi:hypothetical protein